MNIGDAVLLCRTEYITEVCNFGQKHFVNKVVDFKVVTVTELHDVLGVWGGKTHKNGGVVALDDNDNRYTHNWPSYDDATYGSPPWFRSLDSSWWPRLSLYVTYYDPDNLLPSEFQKIGI